MTGSIKRAMHALSKLRRDVSGIAVLEFAYIMPVLMVLSMYGIEFARMSMFHMRVSQMALSVADNASRMEQTNNSSVAPTVTEADVDSIMTGATKDGSSIQFATQGRIILSSLEKDPTTGKQFIHWQRCVGGLAKSSSYGNDTTNNGLTGGTITGMGNGTIKAAAPTNIAVMFVEIYYKYDPLFGSMFVKNMMFKQEAAYIVRDIRDLRASNQSGVTGGGGKSKCV